MTSATDFSFISVGMRSVLWWFSTSSSSASHGVMPIILFCLCKKEQEETDTEKTVCWWFFSYCTANEEKCWVHHHSYSFAIYWSHCSLEKQLLNNDIFILGNKKILIALQVVHVFLLFGFLFDSNSTVWVYCFLEAHTQIANLQPSGFLRCLGCLHPSRPPLLFYNSDYKTKLSIRI